jgi:hypothetical protein
MRSHLRYRLALAFALATGLHAAARIHAAEVVDAWSVQKASISTAIHAERFKTLADRRATDELVNAIRGLPQTAAKGSIAHELLLDRGLHELGRTPPTPAARALVEQTARLPPTIYVRVDPDHGSHAAPLYDPGATARFVLNQWTRIAARDEALTALASGQRWPLERYAQSEAPAERDAAKAGVVEAFEQAPARTLANMRDALAAALRGGERIDELAAVAAERLRDAELFTLVLAHADAPVALRALGKMSRALSAAEQFDSLRAAAQRAELASAATLQIGRLAAEDPRARSHLFEQLADPGVADSAAAALASLHDPAIAAELGRRLESEPREDIRGRLALALQLDGSPAARIELAGFVAARSGSAQLRKDVGAWLAH